jgi:integrase
MFMKKLKSQKKYTSRPAQRSEYRTASSRLLKSLGKNAKLPASMITPEHCRRMMRTLRQETEGSAAMQMEVNLGPRIGELLKLKMKDLDLNRAVIRLSKAK